MYQRGRRRNTASSSFDDVHRFIIHVVVVVYALFLTRNDVVITTRHHQQQQPSSWNIVVTTTATSLLGVVTSSGVVYGNEEQPSYRRQHQQHRRRHPKPSRDPNPLPSIEDLEDQVRALMVSSRASRNDDTNDNLNIIDDLLDDVVGTHSGLIVDKFIPTRIWLYFSSGGGGGIFAHILPMAYWNMIISLGVCLLLRQITHGDWKVWKLPLTTSTMGLFQETTTSRLSNFNTGAIQILDIIHEIYKLLQVFTTFVLILFVQQSYTFWYSIYHTSRNIQSTMSDVQMILSSHVTRRRNNGSYTPEGERYLNDVAQLLRAYHVLFWCSQTRHYRILLTDYGLSRMVAKNVLTQNQKLTLDKHLTIPKTQKHWIVLQWILAKCTQQQEIGREEEQQYRKRRITRLGRRRKVVLHGGAGLEQVLLEKICALRNYCNQVQTKTVARMPLPYLHFVRVVVDVFVLMTTLALYSTMGVFAAVTTGIISVCYLGLLDLSFAFLDPFDDEEEFRDASINLNLSVLLRESTATSQRWINAASKIHNIK
jgi:uncharacterized protein YqgQ